MLNGLLLTKKIVLWNDGASTMHLSPANEPLGIVRRWCGIVGLPADPLAVIGEVLDVRLW